MTTIVGVAGTAKNTGKTTTTAALIEEALGRGLKIGLTSIGYDGEEVDNITGLPKPRLTLKKGAIMATAKKCLLSGTAKYEILETTDIITPLGRIYIVEIIKEGLVVIAGPNKSGDLRRILGMMRQRAGCDLIIVDGALNRIAPMVETDGIILATGASRNTNIDELVMETSCINELFNLPQVSPDLTEALEDEEKIVLVKDGDIVKRLKYGFLIDKNSVTKISQYTGDYDTLYVPALITEEMLRELKDEIGEGWRNKTLIVKDSTRLAVGGHPETMMALVQKIIDFGGAVKTLMELPILAVTVNPFFPRFRFNSNVYEPDHVDKKELKSKMKEAITTLVVNIKTDGSSELLDKLIVK